MTFSRIVAKQHTDAVESVGYFTKLWQHWAKEVHLHGLSIPMSAEGKKNVIVLQQHYNHICIYHPQLRAFSYQTERHCPLGSSPQDDIPSGTFFAFALPKRNTKVKCCKPAVDCYSTAILLGWIKMVLYFYRHICSVKSWLHCLSICMTPHQ